MELKELIAVSALCIQGLASLVSLSIAFASWLSAKHAEKAATLAEQNTKFGGLNNLLDVLITLRISRKDDPSFARQNPSEIASV